MKLRKERSVIDVDLVAPCLNSMIYICAEDVLEKWLLKLGLRNMSKVI